jgi:3-hydroxy-9,10-secoandrosta-1,3,5(10)-triene-9,17-dione monooxygenase
MTDGSEVRDPLEGATAPVDGALLLDRARTLLPEIRERARGAEEARSIPEDTIKSLHDAGLFRVLQPRCWGGYELDPMVFLDLGSLLASACGSTGWVYSILCVHHWQLGCFPLEAQNDVWADDDETLISSSYTPRGEVTRVDGGFRLSGRWQFSSGCEFAQWVFVGGRVAQEDGSLVQCSFLVPRTDYRIEDVWHVMGLKATGSNDIVVDDVFVPEHRVMPFVSGSPVSDSPIFGIPFTALFSYSLTAPVIGMAQGALESYVSRTKDRVRLGAGSRGAEEQFSQIRVAEAAGDIDIARSQMAVNMAEMLRAAATDEGVPIEMRVRARRDQVRGTTLAVGAIDRVFENAGASAIVESSAIQRFWRDAHAARMHNSNVPEPILQGYGAHMFGLPTDGFSF